MKRFPIIIGILIFLAKIAICQPGGSMDTMRFYVDPLKGNDVFSGTKEKPFKTLSKARDKVQEWNKSRGDQHINVWLAGGEYRLSETLVFGWADGGRAGQTITWTALPGETPIISSDVPVRGWKKLHGKLQGLSAEALGKVWVAKLPKDLNAFHTLYNSQQMLPRARTRGMAHLLEVQRDLNK